MAAPSFNNIDDAASRLADTVVVRQDRLAHVKQASPVDEIIDWLKTRGGEAVDLAKAHPIPAGSLLGAGAGGLYGAATSLGRDDEDHNTFQSMLTGALGGGLLGAGAGVAYEHGPAFADKVTGYFKGEDASNSTVPGEASDNASIPGVKKTKSDPYKGLLGDDPHYELNFTPQQERWIQASSNPEAAYKQLQSQMEAGVNANAPNRYINSAGAEAVGAAAAGDVAQLTARSKIHQHLGFDENNRVIRPQIVQPEDHVKATNEALQEQRAVKQPEMKMPKAKNKKQRGRPGYKNKMDQYRQVQAERAAAQLKIQQLEALQNRNTGGSPYGKPAQSVQQIINEQFAKKPGSQSYVNRPAGTYPSHEETRTRAETARNARLAGRPSWWRPTAAGIGGRMVGYPLLGYATSAINRSSFMDDYRNWATQAPKMIPPAAPGPLQGTTP